jgi:hypothetical protein
MHQSAVGGKIIILEKGGANPNQYKFFSTQTTEREERGRAYFSSSLTAFTIVPGTADPRHRDRGQCGTAFYILYRTTHKCTLCACSSSSA